MRSSSMRFRACRKDAKAASSRSFIVRSPWVSLASRCCATSISTMLKTFSTPSGARRQTNRLNLSCTRPVVSSCRPCRSRGPSRRIRRGQLFTCRITPCQAARSLLLALTISFFRRTPFSVRSRRSADSANCYSRRSHQDALRGLVAASRTTGNPCLRTTAAR